MSVVSYQQVIGVLNILKKYYAASTAQALFPHHVPCTVAFHQKKTSSNELQATILRQLKNVKLPVLVKKKLVKNLQHYQSQKPSAGKFVRVICVPLKKDLLALYESDKGTQAWIKASFAIFKK